MGKILVLFTLTALLLSTVCADKSTSPSEPGGGLEIGRGRPQISDGTLISDQGTLLRGVYWSLDWIGELPDRDALADIRNFGMNTLHLYAERFDSGLPAGVYSVQVDSVAQWCGDLGLYLVLTIGGGNHNGEFDSDFAQAFWNHYAPRYKDMPWVIYEIYNEPQAWEAPYNNETLQMEQVVFNLIRTHAPNTTVLLFSYAVFGPIDDILQDIHSLDVDWSNALVAWHGYSGSLTHGILQELKTEGINSICTELPIGFDYNNFQVNSDNIKICEANNVSWLVFMNIKDGLDGWRFQEEVTRSDISWEPDYGTWPGSQSTYVPPQNLALNQPLFVSSVEDHWSENVDGKNAVDGNLETRWSSRFSDPQYITIDLGSVLAFNRIILRWEGSFGKEYQIQTSNDNLNWITVYHETHGNGVMDFLSVSGSGRYVRMYGIRRNTIYGYSLYEIEIANTGF